MTSKEILPKSPKLKSVLQHSPKSLSTRMEWCSTPKSKAEAPSSHPSRFPDCQTEYQIRSPPKKRLRLWNSPQSGGSGDPSGRADDSSAIGNVDSGEVAAVSGETVSVNIQFPHGGWDEDHGDGSSNESSSCSLEIVESEVEVLSSPIKKGKKRTICIEDNAILSGMGEEIERQLEAKAERNRLTVPNVKNILRSVITNPLVLDMVRKSIKKGNVAVSGDLSDIMYEPRITRAKAKQLLHNVPEMTWASTSQKVSPNSRCLISEALDDSDDDEEYKPFEDEPSDNDHCDQDGSERGSERDISLDQLSSNFDGDNESCPPTPSPSPKPNITDSATQTNWSEDGIFKVPKAPLEIQSGQGEENIALRTRSKLPLNDTPLEEIEQAFIPPDITPDLYDTTCDNADWQEFLNEFMQPLRSESHNNDDDEEDPEYNVLADEEIIDKEELRMDKGVKVSKKELKELMKELLEFTDNMSSDDDDKAANNINSFVVNSIENPVATHSPVSFQDDFSFLEAFITGPLTPVPTSKCTPLSTPVCHSGLNTPVLPITPPTPKCASSGKKCAEKDRNIYSPPSGDVGSTYQVLKEQNQMSSPEKKGNINSVSYGDYSIGLTEENVRLSLEKSQIKSSKSVSPTSKGKSRSPSETKTKSMRKRSSGKKTASESTSSPEENISVVAVLPVINSVETVSLTTPLTLEIEDHLTESVGTDYQKNCAPVDQTLLCICDPSDNCCEEDHNSSDSTCSLTSPQKLLLDQQMRQHVQLLAQHFLQTHEHPLYGEHSAGCKELLFTLKYLGESKPFSSFRAANLIPALDVIKNWESTLLSEEGDEVKAFWQSEIKQANTRKKLRRKYSCDFPLQLKEVVANSNAFVYPDLLPPIPFILHEWKKWPIMWSEVRLFAHGFEQFYPYVMELYPKLKRHWIRKTVSLISEHLITMKSEAELYQLYRTIQTRYEDNPVELYLKNQQAPKITHYVVPFVKDQMRPVRSLSHDVLPKLWRDYIYPARNDSD